MIVICSNIHHTIVLMASGYRSSMQLRIWKHSWRQICRWKKYQYIILSSKLMQASFYWRIKSTLRSAAASDCTGTFCEKDSTSLLTSAITIQPTPCFLCNSARQPTSAPRIACQSDWYGKTKEVTAIFSSLLGKIMVQLSLLHPTEMQNLACVNNKFIVSFTIET